jgi:hypothetical protein
VYYQQNLRPESQPLPDSTSTALTTKLRSVRAKLADPSLSLVPVGGGAGAFGKGQMVMKARNAGEAKWAKKLGRSHLDQRKKEAPRQLVSMRGGNNQVSSTMYSFSRGELRILMEIRIILFSYRNITEICFVSSRGHPRSRMHMKLTAAALLVLNSTIIARSSSWDFCLPLSDCNDHLVRSEGAFHNLAHAIRSILNRTPRPNIFCAVIERSKDACFRVSFWLCRD